MSFAQWFFPFLGIAVFVWLLFVSRKKKLLHRCIWTVGAIVAISLCLPDFFQKDKAAQVLPYGVARTIYRDTGLYVVSNGELARLKAHYKKNVTVFSLGEAVEQNGYIYQKVSAPNTNGQPGSVEIYILSDDLKPGGIVKAKASTVPARKAEQTVEAKTVVTPAAPTPVAQTAPPAEKKAVDPAPALTTTETWNVRWRRNGQLLEEDFQLTRNGNAVTMSAADGTELDLNAGVMTVHGKYAGPCQVTLSGWNGSGWWNDTEKINLTLRRLS